MSERPLASDSASEHDLAIRALEAEFGELFARMRRLFADVARRVDPRMLPGHYKTFSLIGRRSGISISGLAEALQIDKGQVSRTVRELEEFGLVSRTPDPHDGRASILELSPTGQSCLESVRDPHANAILQPLTGWDVADIRRFTDLLHALVSAQRPDSTATSGTMGGSRRPSCEEAS